MSKDASRLESPSRETHDRQCSKSPEVQSAIDWLFGRRREQEECDELKRKEEELVAIGSKLRGTEMFGTPEKQQASMDTSVDTKRDNNAGQMLSGVEDQLLVYEEDEYLVVDVPMTDPERSPLWAVTRVYGDSDSPAQASVNTDISTLVDGQMRAGNFVAGNFVEHASSCLVGSSGMGLLDEDAQKGAPPKASNGGLLPIAAGVAGAVALAVGTMMFSTRRLDTAPTESPETSNGRGEPSEAATHRANSDACALDVASSEGGGQNGGVAQTLNQNGSVTIKGAQEAEEHSLVRSMLAEKDDDLTALAAASNSEDLAIAEAISQAEVAGSDETMTETATEKPRSTWWRRQDTAEWARALASGSKTIASVALNAVYKMYCVKRFSEPDNGLFNPPHGGWFAAAAGGGQKQDSAHGHGHHGHGTQRGMSSQSRTSRAARALEAGAALQNMSSHGRTHAHSNALAASGAHQHHSKSKHPHRSIYGSSELQLDSLCAGLASVVYLTDCAPEFSSLGFEIVRIKDQKEGKLQPKWAVLRHVGLGIVVVVFRGTYSYQDVLADMMFKPVVLPCGVPVNGGMQAALALSTEGIKSALKDALRENRQYRLVICGHSYGGACAQLLRLHTLTGPGWSMVLSRVTSTEVVTFGAPLVFGKPEPLCSPAGETAGAASQTTSAQKDERQPCAGSALVQQLGRDCRHYVHQGDIVPRLLGPKSSELLLKLMDNVPAAAAATDLIGKYAPVGSFRVVYTEGSNRHEKHKVRVMADDKSVMDLLEPAPLIYLTLAVQDHASTLYRDKLNSACAS